MPQPYVILVSNPSYGPTRPEIEALQVLELWAQRLDELDGRTTRPAVNSGGRIRFARVEFPSAPRGPDALERLHERVRAGYLGAALRAAPRGTIGVAFGHGFADHSRAWVDLAPGDTLRIDVEFLEQLFRLLEAGADRPRDPTLEELTFLELGNVIRAAHQVRRIDFYCCALGASEEGRMLLGWIQFFWGVEARGLRGDLEIDGSPFGLGPPPRVRVLAPPGAARDPAFGRWYVDRLITTPSLWVTSRSRHPEPRIPPLQPSPRSDQATRPPPPDFER